MAAPSSRQPGFAEKLAEIRKRHEAGWQAGREPRLEETLGDGSNEEQLALLPELLALEVSYRRRRGQQPQPEDYYDRFPDHKSLIDTVFGQSPSLFEPETLPPSRPGTGDELSKSRLAATSPSEGNTLSPRAEVTARIATLSGGAAIKDLRSAEVPQPPGYEILEELGRGGMGVVYRALQLKVKRQVALKMVLSGGYASQDEVARFLREAEAVAQLQHPNIVQLFDVGQHQGLPYFTMEFMAGGSLADRLAGVPLPPREAARLVEPLARGMHYAHQRGIVHRDLKPANILLALSPQPSAISQDRLTADSCWLTATPKITDFGLAKRAEAGSGLTASGAVLGTPSYMAPEQAEGQGKNVGPLADVYALGAILYQCLTGRPPFQGPTPMDTLIQVVADEPVPPSRLQPKTPHDLETICLKCLQKTPTRRYASADELAEDLRRFQAGEPIRARPVGRVEKLAKWIKRRPMVAGLTAGVALLLLAGTVVAWTLAAWALGEADRADGEAEANRLLAVEKTALANKENLQRLQAEKLAQANKLLAKRETQARIDLEKAFARSLLRPLGSQGLENHPLADPEIDALWELAENRGERLWFRFIEEGLRDPVSTRQLRIRAKVALHAATGLDLNRRARLEELLSAQLQSKGMDESQRVDIARITVALGNLSPTSAQQTAHILVQAMEGTKDSKTLAGLSKELVALVMESRQAEQLVATLAAQVLTQVMGKTFFLRRDLKELAIKLKEALEILEHYKAAVILTEGLCSAQRSYARMWFAQELKVLGGRMKAHETAEIAQPLMRKLETTNDPDELSSIALGLAALRVNLTPQRARAAAQTLLETMEKAPDPQDLEMMALGVAALLGHVEALQVPIMAGQAAQILVKAIEKTPTGDWEELGLGLAVLAPFLESRQAGLAAQALVQSIDKTGDNVALEGLSKGLVAMASRLEPEQATQNALTLAQTIGKTTDPIALDDVFPSLVALLQDLNYPQAAQVGEALVQAMQKTTDDDAKNTLAMGIAAIAPRMEPQKAVLALVLAMCKTTDRAALNGLNKALAVSAKGLEHHQAAQTIENLVLGLEKTTDLDARGALGKGIRAITATLETRFANQTLVEAMRKTKSPSARRLLLTQGLAPLTKRMEPEQADQILRGLIETLKKATVPIALREMAQGLEVVAPWLEPQLAAEGAQALAQAMEKTYHSSTLRALGLGLAEINKTLPQSQAASLADQAAQVLVQAMEKTTSYIELRSLAQGLAGLTSWLEPQQANPLAERAAQQLVKAMGKTSSHIALQVLALGLADVTACLEPKLGATYTREACQYLEKAMGKTSNRFTSRSLARGLAELAGRMEFYPASQILIQALARVKEPDAQSALLLGLGAVLHKMDSRELVRRIGGQVGSVSCLNHPLIGMPGFLITGHRLPASNASTQELVDVLKLPGCIGVARRTVLNLLEQRYQRKFSNHWEFVRFTREQKLDCDLESPPRRIFFLENTPMPGPPTKKSSGEPKAMPEKVPLLIYRFGPLMQVGLATKNRSRITYTPDGQSGNTMVRVNGEEVMFGSSAGQWKPKLVPLTKGPVGKEGSGHKSVWIYQDIHFTQTVQIVVDEKKVLNTCLISYECENKGKQPRQVGLRTLVDTFMVDNDGHPFAVPGKDGLITTHADFKGPKQIPKVVQALQRNDPKNPGLAAYFTLDLGRGLEPPDRFSITHWTKEGKVWDIPVQDIGDDAAVVLYWNPRELQAGGRRRVGFAYGLGIVKANEIPGK